MRIFSRCPLYPRKRTFLSAVSMSALGHKRTHAPQRQKLYSITSSARPSRGSGMSMPSALAVLGLTTSSFVSREPQTGIADFPSKC
jgi:hypothetical protein